MNFISKSVMNSKICKGMPSDNIGLNMAATSILWRGKIKISGTKPLFNTRVKMSGWVHRLRWEGNLY